MQAPRPFRGMRDILPGEKDLRLSALERIRSAYQSHGFFEIETPMVESLEALSGAGGDENEKLMFKVLKRGDKLNIDESSEEADLVDGALRYDLTVPLARFYAINQSKLPRPFYSMQLGPVFRAERPQRGRFRQFTQADIDVLGDPTFLAEVQLLVAATAALHALGIEGFEIRLNDRRLLEGILLHHGIEEPMWQPVMVALDKLDKVEAAAVARELEERGLSEAQARELLDNLDRLQGSADLGALVEYGVAADVAEWILQIQRHVARSVRDVAVVFDPLTVRGLAYYTSTVYELVHPSWTGSIGGGGRYDRLLERFGVDFPACGISLGFERVVGLIEELGLPVRSGKRRLTVIFDPQSQSAEALSSARHFRRDGYCVTLLAHPSGARSPMKRIALAAEELKAEGSRDSFYHLTLGVDHEPRLLIH